MKINFGWQDPFKSKLRNLIFLGRESCEWRQSHRGQHSEGGCPPGAGGVLKQTKGELHL